MGNFKNYVRELSNVLEQLPLDRVQQICDVLYKAYWDRRTIFIFGNGGCAALASHMACDLGKGTHPPRGPKRTGGGPMGTGATGVNEFPKLKVMSLTDNVPMISAWANDASYEDIFASQMENFIHENDIAFGLSGSGNSPNVLKALRLARNRRAITVGFTGSQGGKMIELLDHAIIVPSNNMQQIEDAHLVLAHMVFLDLKNRISHLEESYA